MCTFTKVAETRADLMKFVSRVKEVDERSPGVVTDDSVGPTADGFETYGVKGVVVSDAGRRSLRMW
jgi:hypothetical protein